MTSTHEIERGAVMTITTAHPGHHLTGTTAALAAAGALLAGGVGFGVAALVLDEAAVTSSVVPAERGNVVGGSSGEAPKDPNGFAGTDREVRAFMHRK